MWRNRRSKVRLGWSFVRWSYMRWRSEVMGEGMGQPKRSAWPLFHSFFFEPFPNWENHRREAVLVKALPLEACWWSLNTPSLAFSDIFTSSFNGAIFNWVWVRPLKELIASNARDCRSVDSINEIDCNYLCRAICLTTTSGTSAPVLQAVTWKPLCAAEKNQCIKISAV